MGLFHAYALERWPDGTFSCTCAGRGVTAARCRGTFWETGQLYKKGQEGGVLTPEEYTEGLTRIRELRKSVGGLGELADAGESAMVGESAAKTRAELRIIGERVARSAFVGDERIDAQKRLSLVLRALDDIDRDSESVPSENAAPGFGTLRLEIDAMSKRFDEFIVSTPAQPDPDAF